MTGKFVVRSPAGEFLKAEMKRAIFEDKADQIKVTEIKLTETKDNVNNNNTNNSSINNTNNSRVNNNNSESGDKFEMSVDDDFEKPRGEVEKKKSKDQKTEEKKEKTKKKKNSKKKKKKESEGNEESSEGEAVIISETEWPPKWYKLLVEFDDGTKMAFSDPRRLGRIRVRADPATEEPIKSLGYDPILDEMDDEAFNTMVLKRKAPIKALLLDQTVFAGVGNWIADEVLYQSSIHPARPSNTLTAEELSRLKTHVKDVIQTAVNVGANWRQFPTTWLFHFRWDKAKKNKKHVTGTGEAIEFVTVGGRTSAVVVAKQIPPADYDPYKKKKGKKRKKSESESVEDDSESSEPPKKKQKKSSSTDKKEKKEAKAKNKTKKATIKKSKKNVVLSSSSSDSQSDFE
jgi:hypothetical protein